MMIGFIDWFPFEVSFDTVLIFIFTLFLVVSGAVAGILIKDMEVIGLITNNGGNPIVKKFQFWTDENKMFMFLSLVLSVGFWAAKVSFIECFIYAALLKGGLGTVLNIVFKKRLAVLGINALTTAAKTLNAEQELTFQKALEGASFEDIKQEVSRREAELKGG